jgi:hypothetical protein
LSFWRLENRSSATHSYYHEQAYRLMDLISSDKAINQKLQASACKILKDDDSWNANNYKKARMWKHREYNELKREITKNY